MPPSPRGRPKTTALERATRAAQLRERIDPVPLSYVPAPLTMASLPYRDPGDDLEFWVRRNGDFQLVVRPGVLLGPDGQVVRRLGHAFGVVPRALIMYIAAEAVRTKDPTIRLGDSLSDFVLRVLGQRPTGGKNGTITRVRDQANRLFNSTITMHWTGNDDRRNVGVSLSIAKAWAVDLDGTGGLPGQGSLFPSYVRLTSDFYEEIVRSPVPVDLRVVRELGSAAEMDLYAWLTYKAYSLTRPYCHSWEAIGRQFGYQFPDTPKGRYKLREAITAALHKVLVVYPEADVEVTPAGLLLRPSLTSVPFKGTHGLRAQRTR